MLELVMILLITTLAAAIAVSLYRLLFNWTDFNYVLVGHPQTLQMTKLTLKQGYIKLHDRPEQNAGIATRKVEFSHGKLGLVGPWGW